MKKKLKIIVSLCSITLLIGCSLDVNPDGTALMTAINYEGDQRIVYSLDDEYYTPRYDDEERGVHIAPKKISKGDYKPVFAALQNNLGVTMLEHQAAANSGDKKSVGYFRDNWMTKTYADMSMGTVYDINNYSVAGNSETILDLKPYIEETKFIKGPDPYDPTHTKEVDIVDPEHKGLLPNIALFLHQNPGVMMSIVTAKHSHPDKGAIYYVPYFDGFNDLEKATIIRADYVQRLLDDNVDASFSTDNKIIGKKEDGAKYSQHFEPCYIDNDGDTPSYEVKIPNVDEKGEIIDKDNPVLTFNKVKTKNIIFKQNSLIKEGKATSKALVEQFKEYFNLRYNNTPLMNKKCSELFLGYQACYDIDELVALMRIAKVSSETLFGTGVKKEMVTMMPRACDNMRSSDMYRWAGQVFGVRGLESRNGYLYINGIKDYSEYGYKKYGAVHDARGSEDMLSVLKKLKSLYEEGLILQDFDSVTATGTSQGKFAEETLFSGGGEQYAGFMLYDYPKDLTDWNKYKSAERKESEPCDWKTRSNVVEGGYPYNLRAIVGAIAKWDTNPGATGDPNRYQYFPFTESWSSIKTSALCLNAKLPNNPEKLKATFKVIDYIYGNEGLYLYNFGPWQNGYITQLAGEDGLYTDKAVFDKDYIEYQGVRYPKLTSEALNQARTMSGFHRRYVGATIPFGFRKLNALSYQVLDNNSKHGVDVINKAVELETFKHTLVGGYTKQQEIDYKKPFFQISPSAFFLTKGQSSAISSLLNKNTLGSMFTDSSSSNFNIWDSLIMGKETRLGVTLDNYLTTINEKWKLPKLESYYQDAFEIMSTPVEG